MNITVGLATALALTVSALVYTGNQYIEQAAATATANQKLETTTAALDGYMGAIRLNGIKQVENQKVITDITIKHNAIVRELNGLKGRGEKVLKRRTWVEKKINAAFAQEQKEAACITGDIELCED